MAISMTDAAADRVKQFLANLPQPILTEAYFRAHCQVFKYC